MADDVLAARLLGIFVEELGEQVQQLNEDLLALERAPAQGEPLAGVFRVMHTLKGAARAAGVVPVESLCHLLETDLARARDGGGALGGAAIALLFEAADALADARDRLAAGTSLADGPIERVLQHARGRGEPLPTVRPVATPPTPVAAAAVIVAAPEASPAPRAASEPARDELVRVGLHHVDAISNAAGEVTSLAAVLADRADELAALRMHVRARRARSLHREDGTLAEVDVAMTRLLRRAGDDARTLGSVSGRLSETARRLRQRSLRELTETLPRVVRDIALDVGRNAAVVISGEELEADRVVVEALREPLLHLVRNAVDHGLEPEAERVAAGKPPRGIIRVTAHLRGDRLRVTVADDGRGLDLPAIRRALALRGQPLPAGEAALLRAIFADGLSTRDEATTVSGRGVGLGIVRVAVERVGGSVAVETVAGQGTTFLLEVPLSIATMRALTVRVGTSVFGIPSAFVARVDRADPRAVTRVDGRAMLPAGGALTPVTSLAALLGPPFLEAAADDVLQLVTVEAAGRRLALVVDELHDERELVLRPLEHAGHEAAEVTVGCALLGDGELVLVLGVAALLHDGTATGLAEPATARFEPASRRILVVDDSITSRTLEQSVLAAAGYDVVTAVDGLEAWRLLERSEIALIVSDVEMPHLDGIGLCRRIRATARTATLPVILVTSLDHPEHRALGLEAGADAYVTKSGFDQDVLLATIRRLLGAPAEAGA